MNLAIVQARMGSSRLRGKILEPIGSSTSLELVVYRLGNASSVDKVVVATSTEPDDDDLVKFCEERDIFTFRGNETNVLSRFLGVVEKYSPKNILRITSDCPFVDPKLIDGLWQIFIANQLEYASIATGAGFARSSENRFPDGFDAEWISASVLQGTADLITQERDLEHVTSFIWGNPDKFKIGHLYSEFNHGDIRVTLDHKSDLEFLQLVAGILGNRILTAGHEEIIQTIQKYLGLEQDALVRETYNEFYG
ncbi:SpsF Spore coat polysaccharide biosynthesis protein F, CMP-KDO synthetase homolog [Candidatus Nanopelagicaceae bacterium]